MLCGLRLAREYDSLRFQLSKFSTEVGMIVKQWLYGEYRIDVQLVGGDYVSIIYEPGSIEKLQYTPVIEMKHGQVKGERAAEAFVDKRIEKKTPATSSGE